MKNFEFLKDFDSDMYTLLSEFEREAVKNPKITESYVTPFLEKVVNDILQRNNNAIDDPYVGFSKRVDKLYELKIIDYKFKCMLLEAYQMRNAITHKSIEDFLKSDNKIPFQLHRSLFDIAWKYFQLCNENYYYLGKPEYTPIYNLNSKTIKSTPEPSDNRNFSRCIICGRANDSKNSNFCISCNNELEYQNEIINLKNNLNISHFTKEEVNQIHSSMYTSQLLIELTTKKLLKKTNRHYSLNEAEYEKLIEFTYECYDMEKTLTEFLNGKYTSKQIKQSKYYKCGQKGIRPFVEFYKIVENQIFKDFLNQIAMKIPIGEILENTQINKSQINNWYDKNKDSFIKGEHNSEFITYNKLLMEQYLTLKRKQYLNDDIKAELQINDEIISFWTDSFDMESALFKNSLNEIRMNIFLNNLKEGKSKEEALEIAEITDFEELLKDKDFENEYKTEYYENRVDRLIKSLKTMSFDKALKRAGISEDDYNRWYAAGKKQCLLKKDEDEFCLNFYINVTRVLMNRYLKLRSEGKTKTEACKKINTDLNEVKRWCNWNESGLFIDFKENNKKITAKLIIDAIKDGKSKDKIAESSDITLHELNKIIDLGLQNDRICREVYEEYESVYLSKHLEVFLKEIKNKNLKKALKNSGIEKSELDSAYNSGKNGDERFTKFYNDYLNFKISCYITQIIRGKTVSKALKNSNLTDEELKDNLKEIESRILDKQMNSVIGEIEKNRTTRQAAKKARIRIDEVYRWYLEGKKGNEKFKDFADIYHELYVEVGCEIFQNFLNKGKTPKQILKIMNEDITREDYEFWIKNNLISDKNVEAKLYTEDEIKEKIENKAADEIYSKIYDNHQKDFSRWDKKFYALTLYRGYVQNPVNQNKLLDAGKLITKLVKQSNHSKKDAMCPYTLAVLKIMKTLEDPEAVLEWSSKLNPELLNGDISGNYSSKKETWYKLTTKALLDTGQYDECISLSTEALLNLSEFTYDNDVWFKWRIAKSFNQLGEYDQSVDYLNDIKQFKNDWFIDNLMAENYFFKNDWDNALKYASSAALAKGDTDKKVNLYSLIEDILNKKNKQKEADIHAYLVYTIRKRHNWNIDENLEYKIEKAGFDLDNEDYFTIEKHLHHLWEEYLYKNQELKKGVIVSVLPNKKAGFIICDEYPDNLYFSMNEFKHNITLAKTDQNVTFYETDGFDKKKNKQVKNAVNIYLNGG